MIHNLKTLEIHFTAVKSGRKKAEVRLNDRDYKDSDILRLQEVRTQYVSPEKNNLIYTGRVLTVLVTNVLYGGQYGILENYVVLSIKLIK